jgi:hypothetical protein
MGVLAKYAPSAARLFQTETISGHHGSYEVQSPFVFSCSNLLSVQPPREPSVQQVIED